MVIPEFWSEFSKAMIALITGDQLKWRESSRIVFPVRAKCQYRSIGASGSIQEWDSICLLPLNVINEKIFVIIWLWYMFQLLISILNMMYLIVIYYSKSVRIMILRHRALMAVSHKQIIQATNNVHMGTFFVLNQIGKNVDAVTFVDLLSELSLSKVNNSYNNEKMFST